MTDRIFGSGEEALAVEALREQDTRVLFDGRTVLIECVFHTVVDPGVLSSRVREACAGPNSRLTVGTLTRRNRDLAILTKSFINTDESLEDVGARITTIVPRPDHVTAGLVTKSKAATIWAELQRIKDGGV